ncbi:MAG: P-II family nitrogen regulator [Gulosibacter sp.]|uniref:P-II family nitrogen regulator n=1 Tax=Gulosibacter sp. TaxID=2817531 RepID=UPI003F90A8FD
MKLITAVIKPTKLETVANALAEAGFPGLTAGEVQGRGAQAGRTEYYRGQAVDVRFRTKIRIELVVADEQLDQALDVLVEAASTGSIGDGKIWVSEVSRVLRVRTGESGPEAL